MYNFESIYRIKKLFKTLNLICRGIFYGLQRILAKFLDSFGLSIGDVIKVTKNDVCYEGILLDRADDPDDKHIVLKLDSGYNIGVDVNRASAELINKGNIPKMKQQPLDIKKDMEKSDISIISTGGTVASVIDYKTGAVHPAFTADDF